MASSKQNWIVEFYPFENADPIDDSGISSLPSGLSGPIKPPNLNVSSVQLVGSNSTSVSKLKQQLQEEGFAGDESTRYLQSGIVSLSLERSKSTPEQPCTVTMVGPVPKGVAEGTWVLISSIITTTSNSEQHLIRFMGQIHTIDSRYTTLDNGLISQVTVLGIRSWSSVLTCPVKFDVASFASAAKGDSAGLAALYQNISKNSPQELLNIIVDKTFNCFEFAQLILSLIGCINQQDMVDTISELKAGRFGKLGVTMPTIPPALLKRLGYTVDDPENPFQTSKGRGLLDVISGIQASPFDEPPEWNGVFKKGEIEEYKDLFNKDPEVRPLTPGHGSLVGLGRDSAWNLIRNNVDPNFHEVFTDLIYEQGDKGSISVRPVIFVRDYPYLTSTLVGNPAKFDISLSESLLLQKHWSLYDNIPKIYVSSEYIKDVHFRRTMLNSPNYFTFHPQSMAGRQEIESSIAAFSRTRMDKHMRRFGGIQREVISQYNPVSLSTTHGKSGIGLADWVKSANAIIKAWHAFDYKWPSAKLTMKDPGVALTLGFNLMFDLGSNKFVGQIESVAISFRVLPNGLEETSVEVQLSHVMQLAVSGILSYIPMDGLGDIFNLPEAAGDITVGNRPIRGLKNFFGI